MNLEPDAAVREMIKRVKDENPHDMEFIAVRDVGSHSRGMDSPSSDIDPMGIFIQPLLNYVKKSGYVDTIDTKKDIGGQEVDFHAWNIKKFADLTASSNPQAIEFLKSDIEYYSPPPYVIPLAEFEEYALDNINIIGAYFHHRSMGEANYYKYLIPTVFEKEAEDGKPKRYPIVETTRDNKVIYSPMGSNENYTTTITEDGNFTISTTDRRIKKCLNVMRTMLICRYIRHEKKIPTWDFEAFLGECKDDMIISNTEYVTAIDLLEEKRTGNSHERCGDYNFSVVDSVVRDELTTDVNHDEINIGGVDNARADEFIEGIYSNSRINETINAFE